ncbi:MULTISPECIES: discoidin domain-containing protein [unclassified Polaribacter]|uniref:galactose-binding domain-containing protein n=1 Tax=unclassified Polaribacter TaxID=196858 RepID=UPI0011BEC4BE|nr:MULTISPECIES: discoidin domain-containing protein [unclassified Polaribacter]TXD52703.1 T9SS type A sorting domain-containing protein [Polaribacter sp. IC063]TXD60671.1 T9SS type A sorting domain-containing protein [Polaribacter sp. IC066]
MINKITLIIALFAITVGSAQNLALGKTTASTSGSSAAAVDGDLGTRWESASTDPQSLSVDLGASYSIGQVIINWEGAYATDYLIEISSDNTNWTAIYTETAGNGGTDDLSVSGTGRYIRYYGTKRGTIYGHSFWEFQVYEAIATNVDATLSDLTVNGTTVSSFLSNTKTYNVELPAGTVTVPTVVGTTKQSTPATAVTTNAASLPGASTVLVTAKDGTTTETYTLNFTVKKENIAYLKTATASSEAQAASLAFDQNSGTRWESATTDIEWIYIDLGNTFDVDGVNLNWEGAFGEDYVIQVSSDASSWTTVYTQVGGNGGIDDISFTATSARYVRMYGTKRGSIYGYSLFEFEVYGTLSASTWLGTTSEWTTGSNWSAGTVPSALTNVTIPAGTANSPIISATTGAVCNNLTIDSGASLNITAGGSLIPVGTSTGNITYNVNVTDTNWHLVASPVIGAQYDNDWVTAYSIATGSASASNKGISTYDNATPDAITGQWNYYQGGTTETFGTGVGYGLKKGTIGGASAATYSFTGTIASSVTPTISQDNNNWNLIGNSYPSYMSVEAFLTANGSLLSNAFQAVFVFNASTGLYEDLGAGNFIQPGQAFFVNSKLTSTTVSMTKAMQSHQTGVTFYKKNIQNINLSVSNGVSTKTTQINYFNDKTKGLDPGFDVGMFDGVNSELKLYTHLVENNQGIAFKRQALPASEMETMTIPIGLKTEANKEITFSLDALNLPNGMSIYLEDRETNTFKSFSDGAIKMTFNENINGIGRFYINVSSKALNTTDSNLEKISVYISDKTTLRVSDLPNAKTSLKVFNILGKQELSTSFISKGTSDITIPKLSTGVYIVQIQSEEGKLNKKIIIE